MKRTTCLLGALFPLIILALSIAVVGGASALSGVVQDMDGLPVPNAVVIVYVNGKEGSSTLSGVDGAFSLDVQGESLGIVVYRDYEDTDGADYLPFMADASGDDIITVTLLPASTVSVEGGLQFVDTESLSLKTLTSALDDANRTLIPSGVPLEYLKPPRGLMSRLGLSADKIIVPAGSLIRLRFNASILVGSTIEDRALVTKPIYTAPQGGVYTLNLRMYNVILNQELALASRASLQEALAEMAGYGFYMSRQEAAYSSGSVLLEEAVSLLEEGAYPESFDALKRGYLAFIHATQELRAMYRDAELSVYILIGFLAAASLMGGFLIADDRLRQLSADTVIFCLTLAVLFYTYPGSRIIAPLSFVGAAAASFAGFLALGQVVPGLLSVGSGDGRVHTRNLLIPIFNIAKRSLRRRRLRFVLTLTSITLLVMSFVTLTSFSEGYGLVESRYQAGRGWTGVFIREGSWMESDPTFIQLSAAEREWLTELPSVTGLSVKAESSPPQRAFLRLGGSPILGVIGADSSEDATVAISSAVTLGRLPGVGGVIISEALAGRLGIEVGDTVTMGIVDLEVQGLFGDEALAALRDLDGTPYVPNKWVNTSPEGEAPVWVLESCEPEETVLVDTETALMIPTVGVQRVALMLEPATDPDKLAERLALERGYLSHSSTPATYTVYRLGNYFEGRGLTLAIPWAIVVLNVVVTMLNALYERRKEIAILSSVGLNPAQVSAIFIAEATITGFVAGGLGYLAGLGLYRGLAALNLGLQVHQKVSAVWSLASIALAISAVLTGALVALRSSVVITPSLMRRWRIDRTKGGFQEPWTVTVPIKLQPEEVEQYLEYMYGELFRQRDHPTQVTSSMKRLQEGEVRKISFVYKSVQATTGNFYTTNVLTVRPQPGGEYWVELYSVGDHDWVHVAGSLVRRLSMDYSTLYAG
ncbi:hypothetical protein A3K81_01015 [Candidatus Bathyarchaeota archaeon RBG_13_60_20]|nr:MAG: hypothetical protein A3K81_01015 [Candidatus Bathyarchaeota archaeon RBG_13_60_20]